MEILDFFFPHSGSYVRLQIPPGESTWHNKLKGIQCRVCSWKAKHSSCPGQRFRGGSQHLWVSDCCCPGTAAPSGLEPSLYFRSRIKLSLGGSCSLLWHYSNLIWGNQLISFTVCKADWQDSAEKMSLNFQLIFHTHSLPPPPAILFSLQ